MKIKDEGFWLLLSMTSQGKPSSAVLISHHSPDVN